MCMAAGIEPPAQFLVTGWLLVSGEKMSKSGGNQVTPADLVAEYGLDAFRYHLLRDTPLGSDGDFSYEGVTARYNADLANNLGNLTGARLHRRRLEVRRCRTGARSRQPTGAPSPRRFSPMSSPRGRRRSPMWRWRRRGG